MDYSLFKFPKQMINVKKKRPKDISQTNREKIKELYNGKCALCGRRGKQVHHIIYRSEDKTKIDDLDNLIYLCIKCHNRVHEDKAYWQPRLIEIRNYKT